MIGLEKNLLLKVPRVLIFLFLVGSSRTSDERTDARLSFWLATHSTCWFQSVAFLRACLWTAVFREEAWFTNPMSGCTVTAFCFPPLTSKCCKLMGMTFYFVTQGPGCACSYFSCIEKCQCDRHAFGRTEFFIVPPPTASDLEYNNRTCRWLSGKESACSAEDPGSIPGSGTSPGEGNGNPLQYSWLEKFHGQRSLMGYSSWGHKRVRYNLAMKQQYGIQQDYSIFHKLSPFPFIFLIFLLYLCHQSIQPLLIIISPCNYQS